jgi:hypothetical protein
MGESGRKSSLPALFIPLQGGVATMRRAPDNFVGGPRDPNSDWRLQTWQDLRRHF